MLRRQKVELPEWGGFAYVRELMGHERDEYEGMISAHAPNRSARLACRVLVDEHGDRLLGDADSELVGSRSCIPLQRVVETTLHLSGMTNESYIGLLRRMQDRPERRFYFSLAEVLQIPVAEMLERMTAQELSEWQAFNEWRFLQAKSNGKPNPQASHEEMLRRLRQKRGG